MVEEHVTTTFQPAAEMIISDLETLKVLADPLRLSILEFLGKPGTVKRIAEQLKKPPTKLYYHFNLLEKHDLIQLVDTRVVSGIIEKHYQASARSYRLDRGLLTPGQDAKNDPTDITLSGVMSATKSEILDSLREGAIAHTEEEAPSRQLHMSQIHMMLTAEQYDEFHEQLQDLVGRYRDLSREQENTSSEEIRDFKLVWFSFPTNRSHKSQ